MRGFFAALRMTSLSGGGRRGTTEILTLRVRMTLPGGWVRMRLGDGSECASGDGSESASGDGSESASGAWSRSRTPWPVAEEYASTMGLLPGLGDGKVSCCCGSRKRCCRFQ